MLNSGLEGVVVAETGLSAIDGEKGELIYAGYDIADLARNATFEEVTYLLWNGKLPNRDALNRLNQQLVAERELPAPILQLIQGCPADSDAMAALRTAGSALALYDPEANDNSDEANRRKAIKLTAKMPTIVATFDRARKQKPVVAPRADLNTAANF